MAEEPPFDILEPMDPDPELLLTLAEKDAVERAHEQYERMRHASGSGP